jgi:hypothetical protein
MRCSFLGCLLTIAVLPLRPSLGVEPVKFNRHIRPLLAEKCLSCHGPDEEARQGGLRLDVSADEEGPFQDRGGAQAIAPRDLDASEVWHRVTTSDENEVMPPGDSGKPPLTDEQRQLLRQWILEGAEYDEFWSFVPPQRQSTPDVDDPAWCQNRIDRFVLARLQQEGLTPGRRADKRTLIRRLSFDLTGLPPTRDEIRDFLDDSSPGALEEPSAYEKLVDRLMVSPQYGEQMAKYWLDLVRFADTNGIHHDHYREVTPYRDWVIRSFNDNLSFDRFIVDQLAGDLYTNPTIDQQIASGFNRLHLVIDRGTALPEESHVRNVVDRVTSVGTAFMGLTLGCAVCHDHKYDPITQKDFYQLFAFFNNIDSGPETPGSGIHAPFIRMPTSEESRRLRILEQELARARAKVESLKQKMAEPTARAAGAG